MGRCDNLQPLCYWDGGAGGHPSRIIESTKNEVDWGGRQSCHWLAVGTVTRKPNFVTAKHHDRVWEDLCHLGEKRGQHFVDVRLGDVQDGRARGQRDLRHAVVPTPVARYVKLGNNPNLMKHIVSHFGNARAAAIDMSMQKLSSRF